MDEKTGCSCGACSCEESAVEVRGKKFCSAACADCENKDSCSCGHSDCKPK